MMKNDDSWMIAEPENKREAKLNNKLSNKICNFENFIHENENNYINSIDEDIDEMLEDLYKIDNESSLVFYQYQPVSLFNDNTLQ